MEKLVGRTSEKKVLEDALTSNRAELIAIYGRRRVGKTFLVRSVYEKHLVFEFTGVLNGKMGEQLENFGQAMTRATNSPGTLAAPTTWSAAFVMLENFLTPILKKKRVVVFLDEFPWINTRKSNFLRSFDHFWNAWATKQPNLTVVICGSAASWMIQNIVRSKGGLHNRVTQLMPLAPFTLKETEAYLKSRMINLDRYQVLQLYMVMGGIPHYLSGIKKGESATVAINRLCFTNNGYLITEFNNLYASLFEYSANHISVVRLLAGTSKGLTRTEIIQLSSISSGGRISTVLEELEESGFITSYVPFGKTIKDAVHRLSDEYSLFYLKYMDGKKSKGAGNWQIISKSASWTSWSGYAFEAICLKHIDQIKNGLGIASAVIEESIWRHVPGKGQPGAQIDLLIDRNDHTINICEIKFSTGEFAITGKYAAELTQKQGVFVNATKTKKTVLQTMITTYGVKSNTYSTSLVQSELTMTDLFT
ncbi:MAG: AAA family ATPase [Bacteroidetes bacterium]|nr:AAA family ATPase [Bacteroidota bacterium]